MSDFMALAEKFAEFTVAKRDLETQVKNINVALDELERAMLQAHEASGIGSSVKLASGGTIIVAEKTGVRKLDEGALVQWLDANGLSDFAKRNVNTNSLAALCRERAGKNEAAPDGVEVFGFRQVSYRK